MTPAHTLNLIGVLSESKRILNTHSRHFLSLSLLFLLPLSCAILLYPTLFPFPQHDIVSSNHHNIHTPLLTSILLLPPLIYTLILFLLSTSALATITYSTFHSFYGRPVNFLPSIKSIFFSLLPLVTTLVSAKFILCLVSLTFLMFVYLFLHLLQNSVHVFEFDYNSNHFMLFSIIIGVGLGLVILYFQTIWVLAPVIAVTESKWGFEPLRRSAYLVNGMRSVSVSLILVFESLIGVWVWVGATSVSGIGNVEDFMSWEFVMQTVVSSGFLGVLTLLLLHYIAANTVLYMYCKALHGELAIEIAEEFAREYVCLPFDDEKVPHIVTVVSA